VKLILPQKVGEAKIGNCESKATEGENCRWGPPRQKDCGTKKSGKMRRAKKIGRRPPPNAIAYVWSNLGAVG